jgi:hypothetical protein
LFICAKDLFVEANGFSGINSGHQTGGRLWTERLIGEGLIGSFSQPVEHEAELKL